MASENPSILDPKDPEVRLKQFLYVGKEYADYQPGNWFVHNYFLAKNVPSIEELAENPEKQLVPTKIILEAFESNFVPNPETLVFALAVCCKQTKSETLRHEAYTIMHKICAQPEHFILFIKFCSKLSKEEELENANGSKGGWGHGMRKVVNNWYLSKEPLELAKCVTRYRGRYGWKHKDIVKLSHTQTNEREKQLVLKYIVHGLEETKKSFGEDSNEILNYLAEVEDFKHCQDEIRAARLLEMYKLTLDHVPGHLLKSKEVWLALISMMDLVTLLKNLQRIHNLELLKPNSPAVAKVIDEVTNDEKIAREKIHPALLLITIRNYEHSGKPLSYEKRKIKDQAKKPFPAPPKPNTKIIGALYKALDLSFTHLPSTGLRYMVTINMHIILSQARAWHNGNISVAEVGCLIALALLRSEKNVTVAIFFNNDLHFVDLTSATSFGEAMRLLQRVPAAEANLSKPITWAANANNKFDIFINIVDQIYDKSRSYKEALASYRNDMKLPNTKLINCAVCSSSTSRKEKRSTNMLTINGFDATVPSIIHAFATSLL